MMLNKKALGKQYFKKEAKKKYRPNEKSSDKIHGSWCILQSKTNVDRVFQQMKNQLQTMMCKKKKKSFLRCFFFFVQQRDYSEIGWAKVENEEKSRQ